jgi:hypothetical protein
LVQIFYSTPYSQTLSVSVHALISQTKFHAHTKLQENLTVLHTLIFVFNLDLISTWIKFWFATVIPKYKLCHIFKWSINFTLILSCILAWDINMYLYFSMFTSRPTSLLAACGSYSSWPNYCKRVRRQAG